MPNASKELLDHVERPSLLDDLLLCRKDPPPLPEHKHQNYVKQKERPLISPLPKSQVIGKVEEFLEVMAKANQDLELRAQENPSSNYDIEVLNDDEDKFIQLDLLLGVADLRSDEAVSAAETSMCGFRPSISSTSADSSDGDDSDADENSSSSECKSRFVNELSTDVRRNKRPKVVMLD
ncbi:uncharacterized protein C12orf45 isoform X1 [Phalaenopsis equestris]|uniref:uncharacterized protein C12orf45 isoform X1 n=1 Tax=Phalaenopsis equestris TaxID=78828 RepID=UPI0009E320ED|nr:uncharacterized protein C12orf45 isoform X1 [Phalaenopsis equestris]